MTPSSETHLSTDVAIIAAASAIITAGIIR